jgi:DNA polymerase-3 subunit epsilon
MREVVFDTETTGLNPGQGDRIVEVGCIELINLLPTGKEFQIYINPGRPVSEATVRITGITNETLRGKPPFEHPSVVDALLEFFGDSPIVAHNAEFDRGFLNYELELMGRPPFPKERFIDTLVLAREHRPGSPASLDAVCKRFDISIKDRVLHGALLDAQLLAMAYLELRGGRERRLDLADNNGIGGQGQVVFTPRRQRPTPLPSRLTDAEAAAHAAFVETLGDKDHEVIWKKLG